MSRLFPVKESLRAKQQQQKKDNFKKLEMQKELLI